MESHLPSSRVSVARAVCVVDDRSTACPACMARGGGEASRACVPGGLQVIDARAGEHWQLYKEGGEGEGAAGQQRLEATYDAAASWWTQVLPTCCAPCSRHARV
jgi:hypothetical protein